MINPIDIDPKEVRRVAARLNALGRKPARPFKVEVRMRRGPLAARCRQQAHIEVQPLICVFEELIWELTLVDGPHRSPVGEYEGTATLQRETERWRRKGYRIEVLKPKAVTA